VAQNCLVIGCGVVGLTTALELLQRGQRVMLVDSAEHEGLGTSFANGGLLTPSMSDPWNSPGVHKHLLEYLVSSSSALKLRLVALPSLIRWGPQFLLNSRAAPHRTATLANLTLSNYSLAALKDLRARYGLSFDASDRGTLKFFRTIDALDASLRMTDLLKEHGLEARILDRDGTIALEPCLAPVRDQIMGAIYYPGDGSGDAHLFCRAVARTIAERGGEFRYGRPVRSIEICNRRVAGVRLGDETIPADQVIVAAGVMSPALVSRFGLKLAIKPVKGYSMTYTPDQRASMPGLPVIDDAYHTAITPLGPRIRVAGTAEFAGHNLSLDAKRLDNLARLVRAIYPQLATETMMATGKPWAGLRPVAADGRPYIGPGPISGLWINSGHGHLGWTLAAGSARLLADVMSGARPEIDPAPFAPHR
jgi:D-amino-acid dehydrogenase